MMDMTPRPVRASASEYSEIALPNDEALGDLTDVEVAADGDTDGDTDGDGDGDEEEAPALAAEPELELED